MPPPSRDTTERRNRGLQTLQAISRAVAQSLDIDRILNDALDLLLQLMDIDAASIYVLDEHTSEVLAVPSRGVRRADLAGHELENTHELCNRAAKAGRVLITTRRKGRPPAPRKKQTPSTFRTYACVPLCARERVLGVLVLTSQLGRRFPSADIEVLEGVGTQVGLALENARLFQEANQRNRVLAALNAISQVLSQSSKLEESLGLTLARILEVTRGEGGSIYLREGDEMVLAVHRIHPGHFVREATRVALGEGDVGQVAVSGDLLIIPRPPEGPPGADPLLPVADIMSAAAVLPDEPAASLTGTRLWAPLPFETRDYRSYACVPLVSKRQILGVLKVGSFSRASFGAEDLELLEALGPQLGVALENSIQFRTISEQTVRLARRATQLSVLVETSQLMAASVELEESLALCLQRVADLLAVPRVVVTLDRGKGRAEVLTSWDASGIDSSAGQLVRWKDFPHGGRAIATQELVILDVAGDDLTRAERQWVGTHDVRSAVILPLLANGVSLGILSLSSTRAPRSFLVSELDFARTVANQIAIALERARLFKEVRDSASLLEERVKERTRELHEANLRLQEIGRQRADFLSMMSHELRTPLNAIVGFSEVMADPDTENTPEEMREYSVHVHESGRHLLRLIDDILDLTSQRTRGDTLQMERLNVEPALRSLLDTIRPQAVARRVTLRLDVAPEHPPIMVDRARFKQIVYNLLSNAVKFSPVRGEVVVGSRPEGACALVWVQDQGPGIGPEFHERIFEPFFQVDQSISRSFEGAGLGLTLARRYARLHGGDLRVAGDSGEGSRFEFTVALCNPDVVLEG